MKIRFRKATNIRSDNRSLSAPLLGVVYANTLLDVDGQIHQGVSIHGDNRWWRDYNGWYYWAGETEQVLPAEDTVATAPAVSPSSTRPVNPPVIAEAPIALPVPDDTQNKLVPEGEWRTFDAHILTDSEGATMEQPGFAVEPDVPVTKAEHPLPPELMTLRPQRLNWGLETAQIPSQWWQDKQLTGRGVTLAILSTGAHLQHPDLSAPNAPVFANLWNNQTFTDTHGLGTQAAIISAGKGRIAYGIAPEVNLLLGKIGVTPADITPESLLAGLEWAIAQKADVVAMLADFSGLSDTQKQRLTEAIARALDANIVLLAPVGNSFDRKPQVRFPAALEGVISVGAHHSYNRRADFSARSNHLDFLAPGDGLHTADLQQRFGPNLKNTAIATAFAAGFVSLLRQWSKQRNEIYTPGDIAAFLRETAHYEGLNKGKDTEMGYGILNPQAVLKGLES